MSPSPRGDLLILLIEAYVSTFTRFKVLDRMPFRHFGVSKRHIRIWSKVNNGKPRTISSSCLISSGHKLDLGDGALCLRISTKLRPGCVWLAFHLVCVFAVSF
jgi:hypothetical protein